MRVLIAAVVWLAAASLAVAQEQSAQADAAESAQAVLLRSASEIRSLPSEKAAEGLAVDLRGVVTWRSARRNHAIIVHDGERSIWVTFLWMSSQWEKGLAPGPQVV